MYLTFRKSVISTIFDYDKNENLIKARYKTVIDNKIKKKINWNVDKFRFIFIFVKNNLIPIFLLINLFQVVIFLGLTNLLLVTFTTFTNTHLDLKILSNNLKQRWRQN